MKQITITKMSNATNEYFIIVAAVKRKSDNYKAKIVQRPPLY